MKRLEWPHGLAVLAAAAAAFFAVVVGQASAALPDGRGYELASPPDTNHNPIYGTKVSSDGERVAISYQGGVPGSTSGGFSLFVSQRTAGGWVARSLLPPTDELLDTQYATSAANADLTRFIVIAEHGYPFPKSLLKLVRIDADGSQTLLHTFDSSVAVIPLVATSDDMSHVLANVAEQIEPGHVAGTRNVYDFGSGGTPALVSRMPDGSVPACGVPTTGFQSFLTGSSAPSQHWVSTDGRRAFFHSRGSTCGGPVDLYMRDLDAGTTTLISAPALSGTDGGATFLQATPDGSQVFYITTTKLDPADLDTTRDIYRYTVGVGNECLTCAVTGANVTSPSGSDFPVITEDGSRVYFTSTNALTGDDTDGTKSAYLWNGGTIRYIAPVDGLAFNSHQGGQATPDGHVLVFRSHKPELDALTGSTNGGFFEFYRYDDDDHSLTCISCPSSGSPTRDVISGMSGLSFITADAPQVMTSDGRLIVFKTADALVPQDENQDDDLYEWHDGVVSLVTDGLTTYSQSAGFAVTGNQVAGVAADGQDILFTSFSALTPDVLDTGQPVLQLYDARVGGGFPHPTPPAPCDGEQCQGTASSPPSLLGVASATLRGAGNVAAERVVRLALSRVTASQRRAFARTGRLTLHVRANTGGLVYAVARARIGKRARVVARASGHVAAGGSVAIELRLSAAARRALAGHRSLRVTVTVRLAGTSATRRLVIPLRLPATAIGR
jgi:hypothetical protein